MQPVGGHDHVEAVGGTRGRSGGGFNVAGGGIKRPDTPVIPTLPVARAAEWLPDSPSVLPVSCATFPFGARRPRFGIVLRPDACKRGGGRIDLKLRRATTAPIIGLRHLLSEDIATDIYHFPLLKPSTTPTAMTQTTKVDSIFRLSSEQLETRVNLTATAYGVDRHLPVLAPHVAQVKVAPHNYSVVMPHVKAAAAKSVTIPTVGQSGTFQWNWQADHTLRVQLGNLRGTFTSVNQDGWNGEFSYKAKLAGGTSLTHFFNMSFSHDRDAEESTLTYDDAKNHLSTTFDEAAAVSTTASGTLIQRSNGTAETSSVSGSTVLYAPKTAAQYAAPQTAAVPPTNQAKPWQETATADGSTAVTSTKPQTLGSTLDDVKSLMTGLKASLDKSFRTAVPTIYQPLRLSKMAAPAIARVNIAVGWNAMQAVQSAEVKAGSSTALSMHFANQVQARGASQVEQPVQTNYTTYYLSSSSQTVNVSASQSQLGSSNPVYAWFFDMPSGDAWDNQIYNFTGPSTATSGTSRLVIQTGEVRGPVVSGYSTTLTGTYSWQFTNSTTGAVYTTNFTVTS